MFFIDRVFFEFIYVHHFFKWLW